MPQEQLIFTVAPARLFSFFPWKIHQTFNILRQRIVYTRIYLGQGSSLSDHMFLLTWYNLTFQLCLLLTAASLVHFEDCFRGYVCASVLLSSFGWFSVDLVAVSCVGLENPFICAQKSVSLKLLVIHIQNLQHLRYFTSKEPPCVAESLLSANVS